MKSEVALKYIEKCIHGYPPACAVKCPFNLDIRSLLTMVKRGRWDRAYKLFRETVVFPEIVSFLCDSCCMSGCVRKDIDGSINISMIEKAIVKYAKRKDQIDYNLPQKDRSVAIIGGGPAGLACALVLAQKKYPVSLYEKSDRVGGSLIEHLPDSLLEEELFNQFIYTDVSYYLNTTVEDFSDINDDAIFVSYRIKASETLNTSDVTENNETSNMTLDSQASKPRFFINQTKIDSKLGSNPVHQIAYGIETAAEIENYLLKGSGVIKNDSSRNSSFSVEVKEPVDPVIPLDSVSGYSEQEAISEAERCLFCDCTLCRDNCEMLKFYDNILPQKLPELMYATLHPVPQITKRAATRLVASCSMCGLCKEVCPTDVDAGSLISDSRAEMVEKGDLPPVFHDFWLRDFSSVSKDAYLHLGKSNYIFFPGCQMPGSDPALTIGQYQLLSKHHPDSGIYYNCCGAPLYWARETELHEKFISEMKKTLAEAKDKTLVYSCPMCGKMLREFLPEYKTISIYELLEDSLSIKGIANEINISIYDPCASRENPLMQKSVRNILGASGFSIEEIHLNGSTAACCSFGGHISPANPKLADEITKARISLSEFPFITYCVNCRDSFRLAGKESFHIMELYINNDTDLSNELSSLRTPPNLGDRIRNRKNVKSEFVKMIEDFNPENVDGAESISNPIIEINDEMMKRLNALLISDIDVENTIIDCEKANKKITSSSGINIGQGKIGVSTLWVEYTVDSNSNIITLIDAYTHRMAIVED